MGQYILKDALLAKINKCINDAPVNNIGHQRVWAYNDVKDIINTIEVKEVDDEPECKIFPRPIECYSNCKECPWLATNNKAQKGE